MTHLSLHLNFMVHFICKYLMVIGVVLLGFQHSAYADEKDKDKKKDQTTVTKTDTIKIKVNLDIHADDTLVFDDFDEDKDNKGDNSTIAAFTVPNKVRVCVIPAITLETKVYSVVPESTDVDDSIETVPFENTIMPEAINTSIYPNPASANDQAIFVNHNLTSSVTITVYSLSGQVMNTVYTSEQKVELPGLATGIYIVHVAGENQSESQRLLVQ